MPAQTEHAANAANLHMIPVPCMPGDRLTRPEPGTGRTLEYEVMYLTVGTGGEVLAHARSLPEPACPASCAICADCIGEGKAFTVEARGEEP